MIASTITLLASSAAMISVQPGTQARATGLMFMACYSVGLIETSALALAPLSCPPEDIGVANGALVAVRNGGASIASKFRPSDRYLEKRVALLMCIVSGHLFCNFGR